MSAGLSCGPHGAGAPLRSGELRAASPDDYITKITAAAPDPNCPTPLWHKFLDRVTGGDVELQRYLQRVCGYALTGAISEEALFFSYGTGGNGKGTFWETVARILRDYHKVASMGMFLSSAQDRHPTEMASLQGARLVTAMETQHGRHWDRGEGQGADRRRSATSMKASADG